jgi:endonuclease YncB( thermonuclease family)
MFDWFRRFRVTKDEIDVIDGDSINWRRGGWPDGVTDGTKRYRLEGYDSPELRGAKTETEAEWAQEAKEFLKHIISGARSLKLEPTGEVTPRGDQVAILYIDGVPAADLMVGEGQGKFPEWREGRMLRPKWDEGTG